jgi:hypothetical protein
VESLAGSGQCATGFAAVGDVAGQLLQLQTSGVALSSFSFASFAVPTPRLGVLQPRVLGNQLLAFLPLNDGKFMHVLAAFSS